MKINTLIKLIITILCLISYHELSAKPGDLDSSFGENGIVIYKYDSDHFPIDRVGMVVLENQDILAGFNIKEQGYLVKFDKYGNLDKTFGKQGELSLKFNNVPIKFDWICKDINDNLYLLSNFSYINKLKNNLEFDTNFSKNGVFYHPIHGIMISCDKSGKILIPGSNIKDTIKNFYPIRLNINGQFDSSFGGYGNVTIDFGLYDLNWGITEQNDGKLIVYGQTCIINEDDSQKSISKVALCRLFPNGDIDSSFGIDGKVITDLPGKWSESWDCKIQKDGKILISCTDGPIDKQNTKIIRYLLNGMIDSSFGNNGIVNLKAGSAFLSRAYLLLQEDQKIICGGYGTIYFDRQFIFAQRFYDNGVLDSTFGINGRVEFIVDNGDDLVKNNGMIYPEIVDNGIFWFGKMINYDNRISGLLIAKIKTDQPVAVIEQQQNYDIIPYPNPVKNNATINYELLQDDKVTIEIYDSIGKKIKTLATDSPRWAGSNTETIEFSDISEQGTYFIRIKCSKGTVSIKCIKE